MFYLLKRTDEKQCTLGERVMVLADFTGIAAGTRGIITEIYNEGVMVTWEKDGKLAIDIREAASQGELGITASKGFQSDGFSRDELEYLAFETEKKPLK